MSNSRPLAHKTALITGSTSGIGLGIARGLAKAGANIVLNGFGEANEIEAIRATIENDYQVKCLFKEANLMEGDQAAQLVHDTIEDFGAIDILINNAGIQHVAAVEEFPVDKWEAIIALNLSACFYTSKAALPHMISSGHGRIINIASVHGLVASPFKAAYVAAKHGVLGLTKTTALEVAESDNLTVNAICPGYVRTPLVEMQIKDQAKAHNMSEDQVIREVMLAAQPNKRFVTVEELADAALFLASDSGRSMNGTTMTLDGGWTAR